MHTDKRADQLLGKANNEKSLVGKSPGRNPYLLHPCVRLSKQWHSALLPLCPAASKWLHMSEEEEKEKTMPFGIDFRKL